MNKVLSVSDVLSDIEFELAQGTISRDELGRSIQAVRQYQNKVRDEVLEAARRPESREVVTRLFQINEMLITLSQETAAAIRSLRVDLRRVAKQPQGSSSATMTPTMPESAESIAAPDTLDGSAPDRTEEAFDWQLLTEIEDTMQPETLQVLMEVRPARIPIAGGLVKRLRIVLHNLVLFYVDRLAKKQSEINTVHGNWILRLAQLYQDQQEQIDTLSAQVTALQSRLAESDQAIPPSANSQ